MGYQTLRTAPMEPRISSPIAQCVFGAQVESGGRSRSPTAGGGVGVGFGAGRALWPFSATLARWPCLGAGRAPIVRQRGQD